jgi:hypothetical protein
MSQGWRRCRDEMECIVGVYCNDKLLSIRNEKSVVTLPSIDLGPSIEII